MFPRKGYKAYQQHWEDQASFMGKPTWDKDKILKLTISNNSYFKLKELQFSNHSLKKENGQHILRLKVPYNYIEIDDFKLKTLKLLGIQENWLTDFSLDNSHCSHH